MSWAKEISRNKSSFLRYLSIFWPVRQSRAAVENNLSLSQNTLISWYIYIAIHRYVLSDVSIELWSLNFRFLSKHHASHTPLCHISLAWAHQNLGVQLHTRFCCPCRNIRWWWFSMVSNHCIKSCYLSDQQFFSSINPKYNNLFCQIYVDVHKLFWNSNLQVWNFRTICVNLCKPDKISRYRTLFPYKPAPRQGVP